MITLTKEFRRALAANDRNYDARAVIVLEDGTRIELQGNEIWSDGFEIEDAVSDDEAFTALGSAVINAATLIIDNTQDKYLGCNFNNADVTLYISKTFGTRTEVIKMGTYRVDDTKYDEATITLSMLDMMEQFDRPYSLQTISYPATLGQIVRDACEQCSVELNTYNFPHDNFIVSAAPTDETCTYREVISWCATIAGCFARCNRNGALELKWFNTAAMEEASGKDGGEFDAGDSAYYQTGDIVNGGSFRPWSTGTEIDGGNFTDNIPMHYIGSLYSQTICVDETVITGVRIEVDDPDPKAEERTIPYMRGSTGYIIQVSKNPFITKANVSTIIGWLADKLIGLRFRKCNVTHADDPSIEAGDVAFLYDSRQREYPILITRHAFEIGGPQTIVCGCETPARNQSTRFTEVTKAYVENRKLLKQQLDSYDEALRKLAQDVANAHGLYAHEIDDPDDPSAKIYCLHDKPRINDSDVQILLSTAGIVVTNNGTAAQPTWYGLRVNGDLITRIMQTIGINFDWGVGGELTITKTDPTTGEVTETFYADAETGVVRIICDSFALSSGDTIQSIAAAAAAAAVNGQTQQDIFNLLTNNGQAQGIYLNNGNLYINGQYIQAASISANLIKGGTLKIGGASNGNGVIEVYDSSGTRIGIINNTGLEMRQLGSNYSVVEDLGNVRYADQTIEVNILYGKCTKTTEWKAGKGYVVKYVGTTAQSYTDASVKSQFGVIPTAGSLLLPMQTGGSYVELLPMFSTDTQTSDVDLTSLRFYKNGFNYNYSRHKTWYDDDRFLNDDWFDAFDNKPILKCGDDELIYSSSYHREAYLKISKWTDLIEMWSHKKGARLHIDISEVWMQNSSKLYLSGADARFTANATISAQTDISAKTTISGQVDISGKLDIAYRVSNQSDIFKVDNRLENELIYVRSRNHSYGGLIKIGYQGQNNADASLTINSAGGGCEVIANGNYITHNSARLAYQSSSSRRYKHDINYELTGDRDAHKLLELKPAEFVFNEDHKLQYKDMKGQTVPGLIAEDVAEIYPSAAIRDTETGEIESWDERRIIPGMLALIQEQDKTIKEQQARLDELEEKLESLTRVVEAFTMKL